MEKRQARSFNFLVPGVGLEEFSTPEHSLKSGGTEDHFRRVKVPGTATYWKACC
jgi:hypothetical protein